MKQTNTQRIINSFRKILPSPPYHIVKENSHGEVTNPFNHGRPNFEDSKIYDLEQWLASELEGLVSIKEVEEYLSGSAQTHGVSLKEFLRIRAELSAGGKEGKK